ncbi:MAG: hypothetical protein H0X47_17480 [Nitrospirales bacterium]|nr:hypothetical protein [Nitrospirales bacterium]
MRPLIPADPRQEDVFRQQLNNLLDSRRELYRLAHGIPCEQCEERFYPLYAERGRPSLPIRLLVGRQYLKHLYALSDEEVVAGWIENPY